MCGCRVRYGVYRNSTSVIGLEAGRLEVELLHVPVSANGIEQRIAGDFLLAAKRGQHTAIRQLLHGIDLLVEAEGHPVIAQVITECLDDLGIGEFEQPGPFLNQHDPNPERGEHAGVLHANHAATHHDQRLWATGASAAPDRSG